MEAKLKFCEVCLKTLQDVCLLILIAKGVFLSVAKHKISSTLEMVPLFGNISAK